LPLVTSWAEAFMDENDAAVHETKSALPVETDDTNIDDNSAHSHDPNTYY